MHFLCDRIAVQIQCAVAALTPREAHCYTFCRVNVPRSAGWASFAPRSAKGDSPVKSRFVWMYGKYALLGVVVGMFSALFGVGGGIIMVPTLVVLAGFSQHMAQGVSLAAMVPTALVGAYRYWQGGNVNIWIALAVCIGSIPAARVGAEVAQRLPQTTLRTLFALFMVGVAARIMPTGSLRSMSLLLGMTFVAVGVRLMLSR